MKPRVIIPTGEGINSEKELRRCFEWAGADVDYILWLELRDNPKVLDEYQGMGGAGGFAMGDQLGAGQSLANRVQQSDLYEKLREKLEDPGFPTYFVCNSWQMLAKLNLLPVKVGTTQNDSGKHETSYWDVEVNGNNDSPWLKYLKDYEGPIFAPISHGEGRVWIPERDLITVDIKNLIALQYVPGHIREWLKPGEGERYNPNGSVDDIAGLAWNGNLALFPHFERLHHDYQRPDRAQVAREKGTCKGFYEPTAMLFKAAVEHMKK